MVEKERVEEWRSKGTKSGKKRGREVEGEWREWREWRKGEGRGVLNPVGQKTGNNKSCSAHTGLKTNRPGYLCLCEGGGGWR